MKQAVTVLDWLMKSDVGIFLLVLNVIGMLWYSVIKQHDIPSGVQWIVLGIFTGKTVHSVSMVGKKQ